MASNHALCSSFLLPPVTLTSLTGGYVLIPSRSRSRLVRSRPKMCHDALHEAHKIEGASACPQADAGRGLRARPIHTHRGWARRGPPLVWLPPPGPRPVGGGGTVSPPRPRPPPPPG